MSLKERGEKLWTSLNNGVNSLGRNAQNMYSLLVYTV